MSFFVPRRRAKRSLRFSPQAYLKMLFLCHAGPTEVGGFGISSESDPLYVQDVLTLRQECTALTVRFLDEAVADHFDRCADLGIPPHRCGRLWLHTHPHTSALPSTTDEETFAHSFGGSDWAVMAIVSRAGRSYARLQVNGGPRATQRLSWSVDWGSWPETLADRSLARKQEQWQREYEENVTALSPLLQESTAREERQVYDTGGLWLPGMFPDAGDTWSELPGLGDWDGGSFWQLGEELVDLREDDRVQYLP